MTSRKQLDEIILKNRNAVLYVLRITGYPLEYREIISAINDSGMIRGFDVNDSITALLETKCVIIFNDEYGVEKYLITACGKRVCDEMLVGILSNAEKRRLLECALKIFSFERKGGSIEYSVQPADKPNEKAVFKCRVFDGVEDILKLELAVDSDYYAQLASFNFNRSPEMIYRNIISVLTSDDM
ncbi:MAG: DUF4364 family protein [Clostridia bacterium]|nr:DUF4364 family protein [Clostridia bacterium]